MAYMARHFDKRVDPRELMPGARAVVSVALNYYTPSPVPPATRRGGRGKISRYAWGRNYHRVMEKRLRKLARALGRLLLLAQDGDAGAGAYGAVAYPADGHAAHVVVGREVGHQQLESSNYCRRRKQVTLSHKITERKRALLFNFRSNFSITRTAK